MKERVSFFISIIALFLFTGISIGYASYTQNINTTGFATFKKNGKVYISSAILTSYQNLQNIENPIIEENCLRFNLNFNVPTENEALQREYSATYNITITNDSFYDYYYVYSDFSQELILGNEQDGNISYEIDGIEDKELIHSKESKTFSVTIYLIPNDFGDYNITGSAEIDLEQKKEEGRLLGSIEKNIRGDLTNPSYYVPIVVTIVNTYEEEKNFTFSLSNKYFYLLDENNNNIENYTISANETREVTVLLKVYENSKFATDSQSMNIYFEGNGEKKYSMGVVNVSVIKDETITDIEPPTVENVEGHFTSEKGTIEVSYDGNDNVGISHYIIETYKKQDNENILISTTQTIADENSTQIKGLEDGTYFFKVTAVDTKGLTSNSESTPKEYRWTMNVTINITQGGPNGNYTVNYGETFTTTITANQNRTLPGSLTITMGEETLENNYTYNNNSGRLTIPNVTGDLNIQGSTTGGCLIEGTKVKLASGKTKNIEDIQYDDLLLVWNYETGKVTKEYPIWIEKEKEVEQYTKITFSDNTKIEVTGNHAFFASKLRRFISYKDEKNFQIGTAILKESHNKLKEVYVTKIEIINKKVKYYFVASTRYYNIISNDFITTDGYTDITNLYPFDNNIKWEKHNNIIIDYSYLEDVLPYYLYKGFRAGELAVLLEQNKTDISSFKQYITSFITKNSMLKEPIKKNNKRYWTISIENKNKIIKKDLIKEGNYIKLPKLNKVKYWYSTSENRKYLPEENVQVWTGMHFEAGK